MRRAILGRQILIYYKYIETAPREPRCKMPPEPFQDILILTGPTGSGKTHLAVELAERLGGPGGLGAEIISMDSMALYRGMDIGTAKPAADERHRIPHYLLDVLAPWESASVAWWLEQAADCCRDIQSRGKRVLFVGGTPLYLKALLHGIFAGPPADLELRQRLLAEAEISGRQSLHDRLAGVDPTTASRLHVNDTRRVIRALEVWELTGRPISAWQSQWPQWHKLAACATGTGGTPVPLYPVLCLDLPRAELYARIDARVDRMISDGLVDEAANLRRLPQPLSREAFQALGYKEVFAHLDGAYSLAETVTRIKTRSRNFAKRQLTWFWHLPECRHVSKELTFSAWGLTMD